MERPDRDRVDRAIAMTRSADACVQAILEDYDKMKRQVREIDTALRTQESANALRNLPVEEVNRDKEGIRTSLLREAGLTTVYDVLRYSAPEIEQIRGIGPEMANKIVQNAQKFRRRAERNVRVNLSEQSERMQEMIRCLACIAQVQDEQKLAKKMYQKMHDTIAKNAYEADKIGGGLSWLLTMRNNKETRLQALYQLENIICQDYPQDVERLRASYTGKLQNLTWERSRALFEENTAPFYALLESLEKEYLSSATLTAEEAKEEDAIKYGYTRLELPEELVKQVEEFSLSQNLMKSRLRGYQEFGCKYMLLQKRTLLGDEMGLGKTIQAIAAMAHLKEQGAKRFLVVCPASVLVNWCREVAKHSSLYVTEIYGDDRLEELEAWKSHEGVGVITYETLLRIGEQFDEQLDALVVDEAHYVKNPDAKRTKALKKLAEQSEYIFFMSGTPMENRVDEMIFLVSMLNAPLSENLKEIYESKAARTFREALTGVYLRRLREDVLKELPEKTEVEDWCELSEQERICYRQSLQSGSFMDVRQVSFHVPDLRDSGKLYRLKEICNEAMEDGRKVVVFSFFKATIAAVQKAMGDRCYGPIDGSTSVEGRQKIVDAFSQGPQGSVLICQIIAGGVGLNIQAASVVVLCEPQWKPSIENQAIARAYRMGQAKDVLVHRLLCVNTVDEQMLLILQNKSALFDAYADKSTVGEAAKELDEARAAQAILQSERERYGISVQTDANESAGENAPKGANAPTDEKP